ncbi:MAG: TlpA family protein disulfide reductase [Prevotella sp.]|nr:TlpA family protein disulfide reductase [Prevotella sp.]
MKKTMMTAWLALVALASQGQMVCHVEVTASEGVGDKSFWIVKAGTAENDDEAWTEVKLADGHFACDLEGDLTELYEIIEDRWQGGRFAHFLLENATVSIVASPADREESVKFTVTAGGPEMEKWMAMRRDQDCLFRTRGEVVEAQIDSLDEADGFRSEEWKQLDALLMEYDRANPEHVHILDSIYALRDVMKQDGRAFTPEARALIQEQERIHRELNDWQHAYVANHPMLFGLLELEQRLIYLYDDVARAQPYLDEYHELYATLFPDHPVHQRLAMKEAGLRLQPGQPYIDYEASTPEGESVSVGSLYRGHVAIINLWGSWCGPCRAHAKALIPVYEKYKDAGLVVVAVAREWDMDRFRRAMEMDAYPWPSLVDYQDQHRVWELHGCKNGSGKILLIDRDGTILSTSNDAQTLEPLIRRALGIDG